MSSDKQENKPFFQRLGNSMVICAWLVLLAMLTVYFNRFLQRQHNPNETVISYDQADSREVVLQQNRFGHYVANGKINGQTVEFMLDTGATIVSIPEQLANSLQLQRGPSIEVSTANGSIHVYTTRLQQVQLGNIVLQDIRASINPHMQGDEVLLGMSFLKQLEFIQQGEQLILRQYK